MAYGNRGGYDREHRGLIRRIRAALGAAVLAVVVFGLVMGFALVRDDGMRPTYKSGSVPSAKRASCPAEVTILRAAGGRRSSLLPYLRCPSGEAAPRCGGKRRRRGRASPRRGRAEGGPRASAGTSRAAPPAGRKWEGGYRHLRHSATGRGRPPSRPGGGAPLRARGGVGLGRGRGAHRAGRGRRGGAARESRSPPSQPGIQAEGKAGRARFQTPPSD